MNRKSFIEVHYIMFMESTHMITRAQNFVALGLGIYHASTLATHSGIHSGLNTNPLSTHSFGPNPGIVYDRR